MKIAFNLMCVAVLFAFALGNTRYNSTLYQKKTTSVTLRTFCLFRSSAIAAGCATRTISNLPNTTLQVEQRPLGAH
jgi:hypothetical protein